MKDRVEKILQELMFPTVIDHAVRNRLTDPEINKLSTSAFEGQGRDINIRHSDPLTRLTVITFLLQKAYEGYKARSIDDHIIFETFRDLTLRATIYYNRNGKVGISEDDCNWLGHIVESNLFKIGTLQYQPFKMIYLDEEGIGEPFMDFDSASKDVLPTGSPVINCHIPFAANLQDEEVGKSLQEARVFFQTHFPEEDFKAFICYTWLLYPPMIKFLPEGSNMKRFASRFSMVGQCDDREQAQENLFPKGISDQMPTTFLQRLFLDSPESFGYACGMIEI